MEGSENGEGQALTVVGLECIPQGVVGYIDSAELQPNHEIQVRGWVSGVSRGTLEARCGEVRSSLSSVKDRPDVCREQKSNPLTTFGFHFRVKTNEDLLGRAPVNVVFELWRENAPLLRILLKRPQGRVPGLAPAQPDLLPPQHLIDSIGDGDFHAIGREFLEYFVLLGGLRPEYRVLDIGCGVGRMALQLALYLNSAGSYCGFDVNPLVIEWCRQNVTPRWPKFAFAYTPRFNSLYNPQVSDAASAFSFPYADHSFDFVFATSVLTHLLPVDFAHYVREVGRVLRPGGRSFLTCFLLNEESTREVADARTKISFAFRYSPLSRVQSLTVPEEAIGYEEQFVRELHAVSGLHVLQPVWYGGWTRRAVHLTFQDVIIAEKR